jgi:hypothetical protein
MYNPVNNTSVNAFMRWPVLALPIAAIVGLFSNSLLGAIIAWIASVALATWATHKAFKKQLCDCEGEAKRKGWLDSLPKMKWVVEYSPETGEKRPWDLYSMFGDDESTKQHYASYSSEEAALQKKSLLEQLTTKDEDK